MAIVGADMTLPRVLKVEGASEQPYIKTTLQVKWDRAIAVLAAILGGEILAVGIVCYACRNTLVRDHGSSWSVARLLRSALVEHGEGVRSVDSGVEIAAEMQGVGMRYRGGKMADGCLEVGMVNGNGPGEVGGGGFRDGKYR